MEQAAAPDTRFRPGVSGNPKGAKSRKARHAEHMERLAADVGGVAALSPGDSMLLGRAVDMLLVRPSTVEEQTRLVNAATRIVNSIRRRHEPKRPDRGSSLDRHLASKRRATP